MLFDNVLKPYERIIINQRNKIRTLTNQLIKMCQKYITTPYRIPNLLKQISQTEQFDKFTQVLGARFVNEVNTWNKVAFANYLETGYAKNASLIYKGLSADNELKGFLAKQAEEKAKLFKSIPVDLANTIVPKIEKLTVQGATPKTVAYELAKDIPNLLEYQVKTIARTETSKTSVAITGFKSKKNNIPCYQWKASGGRQGDGRTRSSHCKMSDVIIFWENPPAPEDLFPIIGKNGKKYKNTLGHYHAGCCPNCRCLASPVIFIDDLKFPVRVYTQGMIKTMTKKDFLALYNAKVGELKAENAQKKQLNQKPIEIKKSPEELAKENKAKEEERFLNEQRAKVNRLANEINFYLKQINIIKESLQNQTDRKIIKTETEKINKYSKIIQKYKQELEKIRDSIVIVDNSFIGDSVLKDSNIIKYLIEKAKYLKEFIIETIKNIFNLNNITYLNEDYSYINEKGLEELKKTAGNATKEEIEHITKNKGIREGYIKTGHSIVINQKIRHRRKFNNEHDLKTVEILKHVTTINYTNQNLILDRYIDDKKNQIFLNKILNIKYNGKNGQDIVDIFNSKFKNHIFKNNGFVSASYNSKRNNFRFDRIIKLRILTPKGTNLYLTENTKESEVIFPFDVQFQHINSKLVYINGIEQIEITLKVVK